MIGPWVSWWSMNSFVVFSHPTNGVLNPSRRLALPLGNANMHGLQSRAQANENMPLPIPPTPLFPKPPPWEDPTEEQHQILKAYCLAKATHSKKTSNWVTLQWQSNWKAYRTSKPNQSASLSTDLKKKEAPHPRRTNQS